MKYQRCATAFARDDRSAVSADGHGRKATPHPEYEASRSLLADLFDQLNKSCRTDRHLTRRRMFSGGAHVDDLLFCERGKAVFRALDRFKLAAVFSVERFRPKEKVAENEVRPDSFCERFGKKAEVDKRSSLKHVCPSAFAVENDARDVVTGDSKKKRRADDKDGVRHRKDLFPPPFELFL